jgi:hypothetical protein
LKRKPLLIVLAAVIAVVIGAAVALRGKRPDAPAASPVAIEPLDDRIVAFVYDSLVVKAATDTARRCPMPTRKVSGLLKVSTREGLVQVDGWQWKAPPPGWSEESKRCAEGILKEASGAPVGVKVPGGREYELDVELTYPPPPPTDQR